VQQTLIVDGSNIATEGRSLPSLAQLDQAVTDFLSKHSFEHVVVIVDATFAHRIDSSERDQYEAAILAGEIVTPPAGAIGRGDAFILQVANDHEATVLSNDSFQEFHGIYSWLFDEGRLWGGKPIGPLGWSFVQRAPVRGPKGRRAVRDAKQTTKATRSNTPKLTAAPGTAPAIGARATAVAPKPAKAAPAKAAPAKATADKAKPAKAAAAKRTPAKAAVGKGRGKSDAVETANTRRPRGPVNEPAPFFAFVTEHRIGSTVTAQVAEYSSHGAYVNVDGTRCYVPLSELGDPPPRRARDVLTKDTDFEFEVISVDAESRGIHLRPIGLSEKPEQVPSDSGAALVEPSTQTTRAEEARVATTKKAVAKKAPAKKAPAKSAAKKAPAKKAPAKAPAKKAAVKKAPAKKAPAKKTVAKKTVAKKAAVKKAPAKKTAAKKAPAKKAAVKKAPAKKTAAKKAPAQKAAVKKAAVKKAPAKKAPAKKAPAKKTAAKKASAAR
jgi:predicted RNA-binding protein with RPS1 domain